MKILHIGSYNRNLGDNAALYNVRLEFNKFIKDIEWESSDIHEDFWTKRNDQELTIKKLNQGFDCVVVGGGGLIEYRGYESHDTKYKLPFNKRVLESIDCPVFFVGLGINYFRGLEGFSDEAALSLKETFLHSSGFSLRNDGSEAIFRDITGLKSEEIPDPGLIYDFESPNKQHITRSLIQPAFNNNEKQNEGRYGSSENIISLVRFAEDNRLSAFPHTPKDFKYFKNFLVDKLEMPENLKFKNTLGFAKLYMCFDSVVAMRGHGQLISIGLNVPGIYLSTQDKVRDFSFLNGFAGYNVDIKQENWLEALKVKHKNLTEDKHYLEEWYSIRHKNMKVWKNKFNSFIESCAKKIN